MTNFMIIGQPTLFFPSIQLSLLTLTVTHLIIVLVGLVFQIIGYITNYWLIQKHEPKTTNLEIHMNYNA